MSDPKPNSRPAPRNESVSFTIVSRYNTIWTDKLFDSPEQAAAYIKRFWGAGNPNCEGYVLMPATQTIEVIGDERIKIEVTP